MTEEEYFRKNNPDFCYGEKPLSPYWDLFQDGVEFGERQSEKEIADLKETNAILSESVAINHKDLEYKVSVIEQRNKRIAELKQQIEKMKKYGKLLQDICTVMGNDIYMVSVGLENRVKVLWDSSEEKEGLKMVEDIENRLLKIKPQDWAEIGKWEIKEYV